MAWFVVLSSRDVAWFVWFVVLSYRDRSGVVVQKADGDLCMHHGCICRTFARTSTESLLQRYNGEKQFKIDFEEIGSRLAVETIRGPLGGALMEALGGPTTRGALWGH